MGVEAFLKADVALEVVDTLHAQVEFGM